MSPNSSKIRDFFKNQTIFITGGTGFLGKVLIEKLLRECQDLKQIYIMVRPKKGKTPDERFREIFDFECFERLKSKKVDFYEKVSLIYGDCHKPMLGMEKEDLKLVVEDVTCVIHAAANVKFDQTLKEATYYVKATRDVLELAKKMKKLKALVYISTFFANCPHSHIEEKFYDPPLPAEELIKLVDSVDEDVLREITPTILKNWPNTYTFAKSVAEDVVRRVGGELPVAVVRPAIVSSSLQEPVPGWVDNFYGIAGILVGAALGVIRSLYMKIDSYALLVPVDGVANCTLAAVWRTSQGKSVKIYNYAGSKANLLTWRKFRELVEPHCWAAASTKVIWYYGLKIQENPFWHRISLFLSNTIPAYIADFILIIIGRPPMLVKKCKRLHRMLGMLEYFLIRSWSFDNENVADLWDDLDEEDKKNFHFDLTHVDYNEAFKTFVHGGRRFLLKEPPETIPIGVRKVNILFVAHHTLLAFLLFLFFSFVLFICRRMFI